MAAHMAMPMNQYHALSDEKNTAIRMIASRSSTVASVIRNARIEPGSALANNASTASEKAMSVAVGIAHPCAASANGISAPVGMVTIPGAGGANRENREMTVMNSTGGISIPPTAHSDREEEYRQQAILRPMPDRQDDVGAGNAQLRLRHRLEHVRRPWQISQNQTSKREREHNQAGNTIGRGDSPDPGPNPTRAIHEPSIPYQVNSLTRTYA